MVSFLAYANSLGGEFVFDDIEQIVENQNIRSWDNLAKAFTTHVWAFREGSEALNVPPPLPYYRPLFTVMLTVEYQLFGLWPQGWHIVSVLLHALCVVGVFYVISQISGHQLFAFFTSILFAVHPVHAESVSWISGMTDPLFGVFFLTSFYYYLKSQKPGADRDTEKRAFVISLVMFVLSAFAKETALSFVILVFGYQLIESRGNSTSRLIKAAKQALPYAAVSLVYLVPRYLVLGDLMWKNPQAPDRPLAYTLLTLPFVVSSYIIHLVWPVGLSATYNTHFITSVASPSFYLPAAAIGVAAVALIVYRRRIGREVWLALLMIFVPLLPVLNLGQISREEYLVFDHYLYLPVAGFSYLVSIGILKIAAFGPQAKHTAGVLRPAIAVTSFLIIAVTFTFATARENKPWADEYSLWSNVARVRPEYWAGHYNTGLALLKTGNFDQARVSLERAHVFKPDEPNVLDGIGRAYLGMGETSKAVMSFKRAIEMNPEMFESYNNLGTVYFKTKDYVLAEANFGAALRLKPQSTGSRFNLGLCYSRQGRYVDAVRELEQVIRAAPNDAEACYELGLAYEATGRRQEAVHAFRRGGELARSPELAEKLSERLSRLQDGRQP